MLQLLINVVPGIVTANRFNEFKGEGRSVSGAGRSILCLPSDMSVVGYEYLLQQLYSGVLDDEAFAREVKKIENNNTDWFAILTRDVISHNHTLSISGGTESLRYYSSIGYSRDNDVIRDQ